ncbi:hypothetical protein C451_00550, partial [Halococcus thailandensis JCM 13552]
MSVENVEVINRSEGVITAEVTFTGTIDVDKLKRSLSSLFSDRQTNISSITIANVSGDVATVELVTKGRASSETVETRLQTHLSNNSTARNETTNSSSETEPTYRNETATHYQIDFVRGQPIKNLQGPEGTYTNDQLIRFAHGSSERPIYRASGGEFTPNKSLARCIDSQPISVDAENNTASLSFSVAKNCAPVTLSLVSYDKPPVVWSPETEDEQDYIDSATTTFEAGGSYTLTVQLPSNATATETAESNTTAAETAASTEEAEIETSEPTQTATSTETPSSESTEATPTTSTPSSTATETAESATANLTETETETPTETTSGASATGLGAKIAG